MLRSPVNKWLLCALVFVGTASLVQGVLTPDWDPDSFRDCFVTREQVVEEMIATFDLDGDARADTRIIQCIWDSGVLSDFFKRQIPDGPQALVMYCDQDQDGYLSREEVLYTHTCVGNCPTANSVHTFHQQVINNDAWVQLCAQYA